MTRRGRNDVRRWWWQWLWERAPLDTLSWADALGDWRRRNRAVWLLLLLVHVADVIYLDGQGQRFVAIVAAFWLWWEQENRGGATV